MSSGRRGGVDDYVVLSGGTSDPKIFSSISEPTQGGGVAAAPGSLLLRFIPGAPDTGEVWQKFGATDEEWIKLGPTDTFSVFDTTGGQSFTGTITVNLDTVTLNTNANIYSIAADVPTIAQAGDYLIGYDCTIFESADDRTTFRCFLERDTGGGFAEIAGTAAFLTARNSDTQGTAGAAMALVVTAGDRFRLRASRNLGSGTGVTGADSTVMNITRVE